jgi:outer membrane protein assembly factor BamB
MSLIFGASVLERREKMKRKAIVCFALIVLFLVSVFPMSISSGDSGFSSAQPTADTWPMFHHDLTHSGNSSSTAPNTNQTLWRYNTGGAVDSPTVAGGMVYVGSEDNKTYALNATTGAYIWSYTTGFYVDSSPAVSGGIVYVASEDAKVYAFNASTGALRWNYTTGDMVMLSSPAVANGRLYVGSYDGKVYALSASNGNPIWNYRTSDMVVSSPAAAGGVVFVGSYDHVIYAFGPSPSTQTFTPKFPSVTVLTLIIVITLAAALIGAVAYRRKRQV